MHVTLPSHGPSHGPGSGPGRLRPALGLPAGSGPLSVWVADRLGDRARRLAPEVSPGVGWSDDLQLALYLAYEPHYSALPGVSADHEWDPELIRFRRQLETSFLEALCSAVGPPRPVGSVREAIVRVVADDDGPSLSRYMQRHGSLAEMREFMVHRSAYQLKEGDPHTFAIPRLGGRAKQLLVEIQAGEYGADGIDRRTHAELFAAAMDALGLDPRPNANLGDLPATALAVSNVISLFGLNRRWRGALVGHLALFEMTSVVPMGRYAAALARLGAPAAARRFYEVHVLADADHEVVALDMATTLAEEEPAVAPDIAFGARCAAEVDRRFATHLLDRWRPAASGAGDVA